MKEISQVKKEAKHLEPILAEKRGRLKLLKVKPMYRTLPDRNKKKQWKISSKEDNYYPK